MFLLSRHPNSDALGCRPQATAGTQRQFAAVLSIRFWSHQFLTCLHIIFLFSLISILSLTHTCMLLGLYPHGLHYPVHRILVTLFNFGSFKDCGISKALSSNWSNHIWLYQSILHKKCKVSKEDILSHARICYYKELEYTNMLRYDILCFAHEIAIYCHTMLCPRISQI